MEQAKGVALLLITVCGWGFMYPASKVATSAGIDGYWLTAIRYGAGCLLVSSLLLALEGRHSFVFGQRRLHLWVVGTVGFAGLNFLTFLGVAKSSAEHATVILALMPLMPVALNRLSGGERPGKVTLWCCAAALTGATLVITRGEIPAMSLATIGDNTVGDLLLLAATFCWVVYTRWARAFSDWTPLRVTALSSLMGTLSILAITAIATAAGIAQPPSPAVLAEVRWELLILIGTTAVIVTWNGGIKRIGLVNGMLFVNLVPVVTFLIGFARGARYHEAELIGAAITLLALLINNLLSRPRATPAAAAGLPKPESA